MMERNHEVSELGQMCPEHGNFAQSCTSCKARREELCSLLLTPEEEYAEAIKSDEDTVLNFGAPEHEMVVHGTSHRFSLEPIAGMVKAFEEARPDLLIVEGTARVEDDPEMSDEEVLQRYGEQHYLRRLAAKRGIEVRSWDVPWTDRLRDTLKKHGPESVIAWASAYATKHVLEKHQGAPATVEEVRDMLKLVWNEETVDVLKKEFPDMELDPSSFDIDAIIKKYSGGKGIADLDAKTANDLGTPWHRGATNDVIRDMIAVRDRHAIEVIDKARQSGRKTFVLAGDDHVLTWRKALEKMFE